MEAGALDRRIVIERPTTTREPPIYEALPAWETYATVSASMHPATAGERLSAGERGAEANTVFEIRLSNGVRLTDPTMRVVHDGVTHEILGVVPIGRRVGLRLICVARNEGGMPAFRY